MAEKRPPRTEIIIAVIGLVGVLGAALIANWGKILVIPSNNTNIITPTPIRSPVIGPSPSASGDCIAVFLDSVAKDCVTTLESGAKDVQVIGPQQAKDQPIALKLEENAKIVGAVRFRFYSNGSIFKIESIVDSECRPVEDFTNATRGGDKNILQNYDDLQVKFRNATYVLDFEYGAGKIDVDFVRTSPGP